MMIQAIFIREGFVIPPELQKRIDNHEDVSDASIMEFSNEYMIEGPFYSFTVGWDLDYHRKEFAERANECLLRGGTVITYRIGM
jgi:hypothetical protein